MKTDEDTLLSISSFQKVSFGLFKQQVQSGIEQQQKLREDVKSQIKSTQQLYIDFYEKNTKLVLSLFK